MKIEWDKEKNVINVGNVSFGGYSYYKNASSWAFQVLEMAGINKPPKSLSPRERNKQLGDIFGCSISVLFKHFNSLQKKAFIVPVYHLYKHVNVYRFKQHTNENVLRQLLLNKKLLDETYNDGLYNLLPLVHAFGKSPKEIKEEVGSAWKHLSKNSTNKNKLLVKHYKYNVSTFKKVSEKDIPTTLLAYGFGSSDYYPCVLSYLKSNFKGKWKNQQEMVREARLYRDTFQMAKDLEQRFNPNWCARRIHEEHDRMSREITARKYSPTPFEWTKELPEQLEHEGFVATLLNSRLAVAEEGAAMGHCVAGYAEMVAEGNYLVYSVTKDGERCSTIGLYKTNNEDSWFIQQHYGRYNALVKDENEKAIAVQLVNKINEVIKCSSTS